MTSVRVPRTPGRNGAEASRPFGLRLGPVRRGGLRKDVSLCLSLARRQRR